MTPERRVRAEQAYLLRTQSQLTYEEIGSRLGVGREAARGMVGDYERSLRRPIPITLDTPIDELEFSVRTVNVLWFANVKVVRELGLAEYSLKAMKHLRNFGAKSAKEIRELLLANNLVIAGWTEIEPEPSRLTVSERMAQGSPHDLRSEKLYASLAKIDFEECSDSFGFKSGGDGDNGEILMYLLDVHFDRTGKS
jgi:transcriptional regulator with XRE-family HTH domain